MILVVVAVLGGAFAYVYTCPNKKPSADATSTTTAVSSDTPPTLPPPKQYKVSEGVNVRGALPTTASVVVAQIETGKAVIVVCRIEGQSVTAPSGSSNLWLRIAVFGGSPGYVSSLYVETGNDIEDANVIGVCGPA